MQEICLGALGWSPRQFWDEATFFDVCAAIDGWLMANTVPKETIDAPSRETLDELMRMFPDE